MDNIRQIKLLKDAFLVFFNNSSLLLNYRIKNDKYFVDITDLNLINATKLAILFSTRYFIQGYKKKVCWIVKDKTIKDAIFILRLSNLDCVVKEEVEELKAAV